MELQLITTLRPLTPEEMSWLYHHWVAIKAIGMFVVVSTMVMGPFILLTVLDKFTKPAE